jgi:hypothetical protein
MRAKRAAKNALGMAAAAAKDALCCALQYNQLNGFEQVHTDTFQLSPQPCNSVCW